MRLQTKPLIFLSVVWFSFVWITAVTATTVNVKLNDDLTIPGSGVDSFRISPNGELVVSTVNQTKDSVLDLFSVPAVGGANIQLNFPLTSTQQEISDYKISSDSAYVVYKADQTVYEGTIYAVPITGGDSTKLATVYYGFEVAANSNYVVYRADPDDGSFDLYSVPANGSGGPQALTSGETVGSFEVAKSGEYVVYRVHDSSDFFAGTLFSVLVNGGVPVMLAQAGLEFQLSPNSDYVLYVYQGNLYSIPTTGGNSVQLNDPTVGELNTSKISPDGSFVIYATNTDGWLNLYSVSVTDGQHRQLANRISPTYQYFWITPDSLYVIFNDLHDLYQTPIAGGDRVQLNGAIQLSFVPTWLSPTLHVQVSSDSRYVVFIGQELDGYGPHELYSVPVTGGDVVKVNEPLAAGREVHVDFKISNDSRRVIYIADQNEDDVFELFNASITGGDVEQLNPALAPGGDVYNFDLIPNSPRVVYRADQEMNGIVELFAGFALVAKPDLYIVNQNNSLNTAAPGVLENDLEGGMGTAVLLTPPVHGSLALDPNGSFTYIPDAGFWGSDSFTYLVHEEPHDSEAVTVRIAVIKEILYFPVLSTQ